MYITLKEEDVTETVLQKYLKRVSVIGKFITEILGTYYTYFYD